MLKLYRQAFKITNDGIILAIPLALFWWVISLYLKFSVKVVDSLPEMVLSSITILFMTSAFLAGWFYMVKKSISYSKKYFIFDHDKNSEALKLIKAIPRGVARFFLFYIEACVIMIGIIILIGALISVCSIPFVKEISTILSQYGVSIYSTQEVSEFVNNLPPNKTIELFKQLLSPALKLSATIVAIPAFFSFILLLWMPEIIYTMKNPIISLFTSIIKIFKRFGKTLKLYIYLTIIQVLISLLCPFILTNIFLYMLIIIIYFYFLVYMVVLIFSYYEEEFRHKPKKPEQKA